MREEVRSSSGAVAETPMAVARSSSPPHTPVASSVGASSPAMQTNVASIDWLGGKQASRVDSSSQVAAHAYHPSHSFDAAGTAMDSAPSCRPWERGDLLRRLATFKPSTWASKPKAASSLACAQRGWVNVDMDKIECESCGTHLIFNALTSWSPVEAVLQVTFLCSATNSLIGGFKDRCDGLLQFTSLPVIAPSAIENMKLTRSVQIDHLLSQSITFLSGILGCRAESTAGIDIHQDFSCSYSQAQKLISLCGWEPRWLPNVQDCEENSTHSAKNLPSVGPDERLYPHFVEHNKNSFSASAKKDKGKGKLPVGDSGCSMRSPLLDCNLCGATVRMRDFRPVLCPSRFSPNNIVVPGTGRKLTLTHGVSAASGINEWVTDGVERGQDEGRDEAATNEGKPLSLVGVDLNLTMAGGLPSPQSAMPAMSERFNNGGMGRDLMIGQPTGSEVGDCETSYESRGPSSRKRNLEEGGSTADNPQDRLQHADSIQGNFIDRDGEEVDDAAQDSDVPNKKSRGFDLFDAYRPSSGAGPSRNLSFGPHEDAGMFSHSRAIDLAAVERPTARDSLRASSVIAMHTIHTSEEDSMESVEYYPGDGNDIDMPSSSTQRNIEMNDALDLNYSNQAQQSANAHAGAGSDAREIGGSSTNEGEEVINAETVPPFGRDQLSLGISGGSVGMGASHEAEIHGNAGSLHRTESVVGDAEPIAELTETMGQTGESAPGPGLMDEFVPEVDRDEPHGDSQDTVSRSVGQADSGSKIYGYTKADSVESGEKIGHATGATNGENDYESGLLEFDPVKHHNTYCPWVNGNVAAACCNNIGSSSSSSAPSGWQLTIDAVDTYQSLGQAQNQIMQSDSAASLYMVKLAHLVMQLCLENL
ncbi:IAP-like protein 1 [Zea mays]|uniref:IAP-like protein 1 n=1 Tax=Zea mays TaxID=4577 RepID=A0A1D6L6T0_MAIZE|nr:IAP-like protein 1 [Zea mays]